LQKLQEAGLLGDVPPTERNSGISGFLDLLFEIRCRAASSADWAKPHPNIVGD